MLKFINQVWLQLRLLITKLFNFKKMVVTQQNIDEAIELANKSQRALYIKFQAEMEKGKSVCKEDLQIYLNLSNAVWLLEGSEAFVEQDCIEANDVWVQINYIKQNSFVC